MRVRPLRGHRFAIDRERDVSKVVAPPYDQISPEQQDALYAMSPANLVRVSYPRDEAADDKYARARATLDRWLAEGLWEREATAAVYPSHQTYRVEGREITRVGLVALGQVT